MHVRSSRTKQKSWPPANIDVILKTFWRVFTYATIPKTTMGRKGKELSPEENRVVINIFASGNSITEISRLLKSPDSTVISFIIVICWGLVRKSP